MKHPHLCFPKLARYFREKGAMPRNEAIDSLRHRRETGDIFVAPEDTSIAEGVKHGRRTTQHGSIRQNQLDSILERR